MTEHSGAQWCARFPTSRDTATLTDAWRPRVEAFRRALTYAGALVSISATLRPKERGYLMRGAWDIARLHVDPASVAPFDGVDIDWTCSGDATEARHAASAMVAGYGLAYQPSMTSRHYEGRAVDWTITWTGALNIKGVSGTMVTIMGSPRDGMNHDLWAVGAGYGVHKLASDRPHWSDDGH